MTRYRIDPDRSTVIIEASSSLHPIRAQCRGLSGTLELSFSDGRVDVDAGAAAALSMPVSRLEGGNPLEDRELQRRIEARRYPTIDGVLTSMAPAADGTYAAQGDITFRGVTRPHADVVTIEELDADTVRVTGRSRFDVRDFGMQPPRILMLRVHPDVTVGIDVIATRETGAPDT